MEPFDCFPRELRRRIRYVLSDVDDTLTDGPRLPAVTYMAIERLQAADIIVVPVTAAPAGWCDLMCRMWPVGAVIGENGGLCFRRDPASGATLRDYWLPAGERDGEMRRLAQLAEAIVGDMPRAEIAHDQLYRETTLAFAHRDTAQADDIVGRLRQAGAQTTINSLWVLGWFGGFDKLAMARRVMREFFALDIDREADRCLYVGDSLNDAPMFGFFPHSVGVSTVRRYLDHLPTPPRWVTRGAGGAGFVEVAETLLGRQNPAPLTVTTSVVPARSPR